MDSVFGNVFLFLTELAWKSRLTIPVLVTTAFLVMDIRLQIEINIQSGQVNASDIEDPEDGYDEDNLGVDDEENGSDLYTDDLEDYNSEYTDDDSSDASQYLYADELENYYANETNFRT